jgi:hypothetical protein
MGILLITTALLCLGNTAFAGKSSQQQTDANAAQTLSKSEKGQQLLESVSPFVASGQNGTQIAHALNQINESRHPSILEAMSGILLKNDKSLRSELLPDKVVKIVEYLSGIPVNKFEEIIRDTQSFLSDDMHGDSVFSLLKSIKDLYSLKQKTSHLDVGQVYLATRELVNGKHGAKRNGLSRIITVLGSHAVNTDIDNLAKLTNQIVNHNMDCHGIARVLEALLKFPDAASQSSKNKKEVVNLVKKNRDINLETISAENLANEIHGY